MDAGTAERCCCVGTCFCVGRLCICQRAAFLQIAGGTGLFDAVPAGAGVEAHRGQTDHRLRMDGSRYRVSAPVRYHSGRQLCVAFVQWGRSHAGCGCCLYDAVFTAACCAGGHVSGILYSLCDRRAVWAAAFAGQHCGLFRNWICGTGTLRVPGHYSGVGCYSDQCICMV